FPQAEPRTARPPPGGLLSGYGQAGRSATWPVTCGSRAVLQSVPQATLQDEGHAAALWTLPGATGKIPVRPHALADLRPATGRARSFRAAERRTPVRTRQGTFPCTRRTLCSNPPF